MSAAPRLSDRAKAEQRLGWKLAMPAFVVMLLVTAYPILQAIWNSFFAYRLTDPDNREFVGLNNYVVSFSDSVFWSAMLATVIITVITVQPGAGSSSTSCPFASSVYGIV